MAEVGLAPRAVRKGEQELAWVRPAHLEVLGTWGKEVGGFRVASGTPREVLAFGVPWLRPCRRASKKIGEPAALAKVLREGTIKCAKGLLGPAKSQAQL